MDRDEMAQDARDQRMIREEQDARWGDHRDPLLRAAKRQMHDHAGRDHDAIRRRVSEISDLTPEQMAAVRQGLEEVLMRVLEGKVDPLVERLDRATREAIQQAAYYQCATDTTDFPFALAYVNALRAPELPPIQMREVTT